MLRVDADAHVLETEETWEFMDGADRKYRPEVVGSTNGSGSGDEYWLVDGTLRLKSRNVGKDTPLESRELRDVAVRLKHMDELKVDIQVIFPTIFIIPLTPRPEIELALCRSYNRWMGECWKQSDNRLRWVAVVPLLSPEQVYEEARLAKENGAVGIYMRGSEGERLLNDPFFYPVYDAAGRLDMPVCIHASNGSSVLHDYYKYEPVAFSKFKLVVVGAFHTIVAGGIPERFPKLKMGFLEVSAQWLPYALTDLYKRPYVKEQGFKRNELLAKSRIWVGCETTDDLPYVIDNAGEDNLVVGTDYGHADSATELLAIDGVANDPRLSPEVKDKIVGENARALYNL